MNFSNDHSFTGFGLTADAWMKPVDQILEDRRKALLDDERREREEGQKLLRKMLGHTDAGGCVCTFCRAFVDPGPFLW